MVEPMGYHVVTVFMFITTELLKTYHGHSWVHLFNHKRSPQLSQIGIKGLLAVRRLLRWQHLRLARQVGPKWHSQIREHSRSNVLVGRQAPLVPLELEWSHIDLQFIRIKQAELLH